MTDLPIDFPRLTRSGAGRVSAPDVRHNTGSAYLDKLAAEHDRIWKGFMAGRGAIVHPPENTLEEREAEAQAFCWAIVAYHESSPATPIAHIQRVVAIHFGVSRNDIISARRTANVMLPRHIAMYLCKVLTPRSLSEIARLFGNRDHTTVLHAVRNIARLVITDKDLAGEIEILRARLEQ